jgi:SAM-dependent methyltransferase
MSTEASKTKLLCMNDILPYLKGDGIDIGCGADPILEAVEPFDKEQGDANEITQFIKKRYDFVFSSHALEHMHDPYHAISEWFSLLKPGGYLVVLVPDEDLYEQGVFPSIFNADHKFTFTISKTSSWSPKSVNVFDLTQSLPGKLISVKLQDIGYDRKLVKFQPNKYSIILGNLARRVSLKLPIFENFIIILANKFGAVVDQTFLRKKMVLAQILFIVQKNA